MSDVTFREVEQKMDNALEAVRREFSKLRAGKATPALLEGVRVDAYGQSTPLNQVGTIGVPEPRLLVVQPWDKSLIGAIEKAIRASDLGLNPANDGQVVRVPIPPLTEERRKELIRLTRNMAEDGRIAIRNIRRHCKDDLEALQGDVSEDDIRRAEAELQELTDQHIKKLDELLLHKEGELMEV